MAVTSGGGWNLVKNPLRKQVGSEPWRWQTVCELLGMDCNTPTDIVFSFTALARRGGDTGPHRDGFGLAFFEGRAARLFLDSSAAARSPLGRFLRENPIKTLQAVAHIRKRTHGPVGLANTHPFQRELWGRVWVFAHNGTLRGLPPITGRFTPVGRTDSERAFCLLLAGLERRFPQGPPSSAADLHRAVAAVGGALARHGSFNFLLANGKHLYARCCTRLCHIVRKAPFGRATLQDADVAVDFAALTTPKDRVAVVATTPLTRDEQWTVGEPGTLWVFHQGRLSHTLASAPGRGKAPVAQRSRRNARMG